MKRFVTLTVVLLAVFAFSYNAQAEIKERGFFLGGGVGYAWENFDTDDLDNLGLNVDVDDSWGFNLFVGYRLMRYFALEGNYNWYDDFKVDVNGFNFDVGIWTLMLDLKAMVPVYNDRLVPYVRLGGGYMSADADMSGTDFDENDFAWNLGAGADYFVTDKVSLGLDGKYVWGTDDLDNLEYFVGTVRVAYHF